MRKLWYSWYICKLCTWMTMELLGEYPPKAMTGNFFAGKLKTWKHGYGRLKLLNLKSHLSFCGWRRHQPGRFSMVGKNTKLFERFLFALQEQLMGRIKMIKWILFYRNVFCGICIRRSYATMNTRNADSTHKIFRWNIYRTLVVFYRPRFALNVNSAYYF